jgi:hypothetical protein
MPWFNVGSGSRRGKPKRAQRFQQADRVVVEVFADLHEVGQLKKASHPRHFHSGLNSSPFRNSGYNNDQPAVATSSRKRRKLGYQRFSKRA